MSQGEVSWGDAEGNRRAPQTSPAIPPSQGTVESHALEEKEIETLNALYQEVKRFPEILENAAKATTELFSLEDEYRNPFRCIYKVTELVEEVRNNLIDFVIERVAGNKNFQIDTREVIEYVDKTLGGEFDAKVVSDYIRAKYLRYADELSLREITSKALMLMPVFWKGFERRKPELQDIVKKDKVILRNTIDWRYRSASVFDFISYVVALEKFIRVTLNGEKPSTVRGEHISTVYWNADEKTLLKKHMICDGIIKSVKAYKNRKFEVQLYSEEDALKVASALIEAEASRL